MHASLAVKGSTAKAAPDSSVSDSDAHRDKASSFFRTVFFFIDVLLLSNVTNSTKVYHNRRLKGSPAAGN